jgi:PTS system mannose-specific IIA component
LLALPRFPAIIAHFFQGALRPRRRPGTDAPNRNSRLDADPRRQPGRARMIGIVLVTHGGLANEFREALEHVVGPQRRFAAIGIEANDDMERRRADIEAAVKQADEGAGVILLTDMFGGTPSNLAISLMQSGKVEVIAGVNLPMLIKLASVRGDDNLARAVDCAQEAGRKYINVASKLLQSQ